MKKEIWATGFIVGCLTTIMSKSRLTIGLIAEDRTDCEAIKEIVKRVRSQAKTKSWASKGCSHLRRKLQAKINNMSEQGCTAFIILHDLDRNPLNNSLNNEHQLREELKQKSVFHPQKNVHICIPIEELEAWFWSDQKIVSDLGKGKGKSHRNPHLITKPKEKLIKLSQGENRKPRYSTNMNHKHES